MLHTRNLYFRILDNSIHLTVKPSYDDDLDDCDLPAFGDNFQSQKLDLFKFSNRKRRIVDPFQVDFQVHAVFDDHYKPGTKYLCKSKFRDVRLADVKDHVMRSQMTFVCNKCNFAADVWSEILEDGRMDIGTSIFCAAVQIGTCRNSQTNSRSNFSKKTSLGSVIIIFVLKTFLNSKKLVNQFYTAIPMSF